MSHPLDYPVAAKARKQEHEKMALKIPKYKYDKEKNMVSRIYVPIFSVNYTRYVSSIYFTYLDWKNKIIFINQLLCFIILASRSWLNLASSFKNWARGFIIVCLSPRHFGQYHFPLGLAVRPIQPKWNHSMGHKSLSQPIISP